jgi:hypothetical protein
MPLSEHDTKEALRDATDWLVASELPGSAAAREGIADTITTPEDVQRAQLKEAVKAAFDYVRSLRRAAAR